MIAVLCLVLAWCVPGPGGGPVTGYRVHAGNLPRQYAETADVGNVLTWETSIPGVRRFWAVTAYNDAGDSDYSNEVCYPPLRVTIARDDTGAWLGWDAWTGETFNVWQSGGMDMPWQIIDTITVPYTGPIIFPVPDTVALYQIEITGESP